MRFQFAAAIIVAVLAAAVFGQVRAHEFVRYDDGVHVYENLRVQQGLSLEGIRWAFTTTHFGNWFPVTWLSYLLDYEVYGLNASGYHMTNLLIHAANAILILFLLTELSGAVVPALIVTCIFVVHPINVEPVVWVSSRKDLLCMFFWLTTLMAYRIYGEKPRVVAYAVVTFSLLLSLMSKGMAITLPFVLILMDMWPLGRWKRDQSPWVLDNKKLLLEKMPWFGMSAVSMMVNLNTQQHLQAQELRNLVRLDVGVGNAVANYARYLGKYIWPSNLTPNYPLESLDFPWVPFTLGLAVVAIVAIVGWLCRKKHPSILFGWCWFLGVFVPVIGLIPIADRVIADRYMYIPQVGLLIAAACFVTPFLERRRSASVAVIIAAGVLISGYGYASWQQASHWRSSEALFTHMLRLNSEDLVAHTNLGLTLAEKPETREDGFAHLVHVIETYESEGALPARRSSAYNNLASVYLRENRFGEAVPILETALEVDRNNHVALYNLAMAHYRLGDPVEAMKYCYRALQISPDDPKAVALNGELRKNLQE